MSDLNGYIGSSRMGYKRIHASNEISYRNMLEQAIFSAKITYDFKIVNNYF